MEAQRYRDSAVILVVDDELVARELTQAMLTRHGYHAIAAQSGAEALRLFDANPEVHIDAALIDIVLPDMTGLELAKELRHLRPRLPMLFMSSYSQDPALRPANTREIPFLAKPFSSARLIKAIETAMASRRQRTGAE